MLGDRFHGIYWPAFLMALDLPLPRRILAHGHWTLGNEKMSKSKGNVVNPFFAIDRFGVEPLRYFLLRHGGRNDDSDYSNYRVISCYQVELRHGLGNLTSRLTRAKGWSVREALRRVRPAENLDITSVAGSLNNKLSTLAAQVTTEMERVNPNTALQEIWAVVAEVSDGE